MKDMVGTTINVGDRVAVLDSRVDGIGEVGTVVDSGVGGPEVEFTYDLSADRPFPKPFRERVTGDLMLVLK